MTVIAAVAREGQVVIGTDDVCIQAGRYFPGPTKVRRVRCTGSDLDVLVAAAGAAELLTYFLRHNHVSPPGRDLEDWAQGMAEDVTACAAGMTPSALVGGETPNERGSMDGLLLLGHAGRLWTLDANMAVHVADGLVAIGSGGEVAIGALHVAMNYGATPRDAVTRAVELACRLTESAAVLGSGPVVEELSCL